MRSFVSSIVTVLALVIVSGTAVAGDGSNAPAAKPVDKPAKVKVYDFTAQEIEGATVKPDGIGVAVTDFGKHGSLIRIRTNFTAEMIKSGEEL